MARVMSLARAALCLGATLLLALAVNVDAAITAPPPSGKFHKLWSTRIGGKPSAPALVQANAELLLTGNDGFAYALNAFDGSVSWRTALPAASSCTPVVVTQTQQVIVVSEDGSVNVLNLLDGSVAVKTPYVLEITPVKNCEPIVSADGEMVIINIRNQNNLVALFTANWTQVWQNSGQSKATISGDNVFVGDSDGDLYWYNMHTGFVTNSYDSSEGDCDFSRPLIRNSAALFTSQCGFFKVDFGSSDITPWSAPQFTSTWSSCVLTDSLDTAIFGTDDGTLAAVDPFLKSVSWTFNTTDNAPIVTTPLLHNNVVYFGTAYGGVYAVGISSGKPSLLAFTNLTAPLALYGAPQISEAYGAVYFAAADGTVIAVSVNNATLPPAPTTTPSANNIIENRCQHSDCTSCRQFAFAPGCVAMAQGLSAQRRCVNGTLSVAFFTNTGSSAANCTGTASTQLSYALNQCYAQPDGSSVELLQCP